MQIKEQEDLVPALQEITIWCGKYDVHTHGGCLQNKAEALRARKGKGAGIQAAS